MGIVPTFDEFRHRLVCLWLVVEGSAIEKFTFQSSEEALADGVIKTFLDWAKRHERGETTGTERKASRPDAAMLCAGGCSLESYTDFWHY
jgi:hypothetical protein